MKEEWPCVCVCVMVLISIPGARMCLVCLYKIHNLISNVLIRVCVRMWPGVRKTEMKREEKADTKRADKKRADKKQADKKQADKKNRVRERSERIRMKMKW